MHNYCNTKLFISCSTFMISINNISKSFSDKIILDNLSFKINHGETLSIIGPSGSGKTTILRTIAGLQKLSSGEIFLKDKLIGKLFNN